MEQASASLAFVGVPVSKDRLDEHVRFATPMAARAATPRPGRAFSSG